MVAVEHKRIDVDPIILGYAVRYAIGRRTYAPSDVIRELELHAEHLPTILRRTLATDIRVGLAASRDGMRPEDVRDWDRALDVLDPERQRPAA